MKTSLIIILLYFLQFTASGQIKIEQMQIADEGIPLHLTFCMIQDSKGFIWFGTMYGLIRFDGKDFKTYRHDPDDKNSISFDDVVSLYEDVNGNIWIGTWGGGLNLFDTKNETFKRFPSEKSGNIIWDIRQDNSGSTWFITEQNGLKKYNDREGFISYPVEGVNKIFVSEENIFFVSGKGILTYLKENDTVVSSSLFSSFSDSIIYDIISDNNGNFILASESSLFTINYKGSIISSVPFETDKGRGIKLFVDNENNFWTAGGSGLKKIKAGNSNINSMQVYDDPVHDLFIDRSGVMWISSYNRGVSKILFKKEFIRSFKTEFAKSFDQDENGNVWIGAAGSGLIKINPLLPDIKFLSSSAGSVNDLIIINGKILYVNNKGLFEYDPGTNNNKNILKGSFSLLIMHENDLFLGTPGRGLYRYNLLRKKTELLEFEFTGKQRHHDHILTMFIDSHKILWIGTYGGLVKVDLNTFSDELFFYDDNKPETISNNYVFSITEDKNGTLWIGTANGLNRFDRKAKTFERFGEKEGLPNSVINGIAADEEGNLWITTNKGLSRFDLSKKIFTDFRYGSGFIDNIPLVNSIFKDKKGFIYYGSASSVSFFHPDSILLSSYQPQTAITGFISKNEELFPENNSLTLNPDQNYFVIKFASFDYTDPTQNKFRYILEGFDSDWNYSGSRNFASYTNIPPGKYIFKVNGTNSDGIWSVNEAAVLIEILPPFYLTTWFILLSAALLILSLYVFYKIKIRREIQMTLALEKARREQSEITRKNTSLDFHDELGHRLTRITLLTELIRRRTKESDFIYPLLNKISENAKDLYTDMKDFVWAIDPRDDSLYELIVRLKDFGDDLFTGSDIYFEVNGMNEEYKNFHLPMDYRRHLIMLFKEGMNNSIKYAGSNKVVFESRVNSKDLILSLTDFGKGIIEINDNGRGIKSMKKRAELLRGDLQINSDAGTGTKIVFRGKVDTKDLHLD